MNIAVCMKQVPAFSEGAMDERTGLLIRSSMETVVNRYDLSALETALRIKELLNGEVKITVFTMGPPQAEQVLKEAYAYGADEGYLICDKAFAGADVLATAYTLMQAIRYVGAFQLILCGKQTTDGDTAQVSGALAGWLSLPHLNWVSELLAVDFRGLELKYQMGNEMVRAKVSYPCLLSVEPAIYKIRLPSLKMKLKTRSKEVKRIVLSDLADQEKEHYGLAGSATKVKRIYPPPQTEKKAIKEFSGAEAALYIYDVIFAKKQQ